jgi:hypothetical protein
MRHGSRWLWGLLWLAGLAAVLFAVHVRPRLVSAAPDRFAGFTPDGRQFVTLPANASDDQFGSVALFRDVTTGRHVASLRSPWPIDSLIFSRDGGRAFSIYSHPFPARRSRLQAWDRVEGGSWSEPFVVEVGPGSNTFQDFLPDDRAILMSDYNHLTLWEPPGRSPQPLPLEAMPPESRALRWALSPDGSCIAVEWCTEKDWAWPFITVYDYATGRARFTRELLDKPGVAPFGGGKYQVYVGHLEFSHDSSSLVVGGQANWGLIEPSGQLDRNFVCLLDATTGVVRARLASHYGPALTADGRALISVRPDP